MISLVGVRESLEDRAVNSFRIAEIINPMGYLLAISAVCVVVFPTSPGAAREKALSVGHCIVQF